MIDRFALALLLSFGALALSARADGPRLRFENSGAVFSGDYVTDGNLKRDSGFFGMVDVEDLVKDHPTALALAQKENAYVTRAHLSYWLGVLPSSIVTVIGASERESAVTAIGGIVLVVTTLSLGYSVAQARHYMHEAVNAYNGVPRPLGPQAAADVSRFAFSCSF